MAKNEVATSTSPRFFSPRFAGSFVFHLLFWRDHKIYRRGMVEWHEPMADIHFSAFQFGFSAGLDFMGISLAIFGNSYLSFGNWIPDLYLVEEDARNLADVRYRDARSGRVDNGFVSFFAH